MSQDVEALRKKLKGSEAKLATLAAINGALQQELDGLRTQLAARPMTATGAMVLGWQPSDRSSHSSLD